MRNTERNDFSIGNLAYFKGSDMRGIPLRLFLFCGARDGGSASDKTEEGMGKICLLFPFHFHFESVFLFHRVFWYFSSPLG